MKTSLAVKLQQAKALGPCTSIMQNKIAFKDSLCFSIILTVPVTRDRDWALTEVHHLAKHGRPVLCQLKKLHQFQLLCTMQIIRCLAKCLSLFN